MKLKNQFPWLNSRRFSTSMPVSNELHEATDLDKLYRLAERMKRGVLRRVATPIEIVESNTRNHEIAFLRTLYADTEPGKLPRFAGFLVHRLITTNAGSIRMGFDLYPHIHSLDQPIEYFPVAEWFVDLWRLAIPGLLVDVPEDSWSWAHYQVKEWLVEFIDQLLRATLCLKSINRQFSRATNLDRRALFISRNLFGHPRAASPNSYESARAHYPWLTSIQKDEPRLIWFAYCLTDNPCLDARLEPVAAIRQWTVAQGLGPKGWRLLLDSPSWYWDYLRALHGYDGPLGFLQQVIAWLRRHEACNLPVLVPDRFAQLFFEAEERTTDRNNQLEAFATLSVPLFMLLARKSIQAEAEGTLEDWLTNDVRRFQTWIDDHPGFAPDKNQLKAGWNWLSRKMTLWADAVERGAVKSKHRWEYSLENLAADHYEAVALPTCRALWDEGRHMCHCVGEMGHLAAQGAARFFSIRHRENQKRVATLQIGVAANDSVWRIDQCRGCCNSEPEDEVIAFAEKVAFAYNQACGLVISDQDLAAAYRWRIDLQHQRLTELLDAINEAA